MRLWPKAKRRDPTKPPTRDEAIEMIGELRREQEKVVKHDSSPNAGHNTPEQPYAV